MLALAIGLDAARNIAIAVVVLFLMGAIASAWIMKTIMQKAAVAFVMVLLAFSVYTQRSALQDCADQVKANISRNVIDVELDDTQCSFFGANINISDPRERDT